MYLLAHLAAGAFLVNCIPHLASGLRGESFPTPFAKPPGKGLSSGPVNFLWGSLNLVVGCFFLQLSPIEWTLNINSLEFLVTFLGLGLYLSSHFAKVRRGSASS